jgi:hypothetical protein
VSDPHKNSAEPVDWHKRAEFIDLRDEVNRLREALSFYANAEYYDDWHDTGRTERQTSPVPAERWVNDGSGKCEYAGWDYEDQEFDAPVWESTVSEDHGQRAREALEAGER